MYTINVYVYTYAHDIYIYTQHIHTYICTYIYTHMVLLQNGNEGRVKTEESILNFPLFESSPHAFAKELAKLAKPALVYVYTLIVGYVMCIYIYII